MKNAKSITRARNNGRSYGELTANCWRLD